MRSNEYCKLNEERCKLSCKEKPENNKRMYAWMK